MKRFLSLFCISSLTVIISVLLSFTFLFKDGFSLFYYTTQHQQEIETPIVFTKPPIKTSKFLSKKSDVEKQLEALRKHKELQKEEEDENVTARRRLAFKTAVAIENRTVSKHEKALLGMDAQNSSSIAPNNQEKEESDEKEAITPSATKISSVLLPWRNPDDVCCNSLREASRAILGVPSEMMNLLPTLFSYFREKEHKTIVEIGSRLGYSTNTLLDAMSYTPTTKRFATLDLEIRQPIKALYRCEKICTENSAGLKRREFFTVEGNDLQVDIPFVSSSSSHLTAMINSGGQSEENRRQQRPIDVLFIDTLHHGAQLQMELERYPQYVDKYILFHDVHSFKTGNEGPKNFKPVGWKQGQSIPQGLHPILKQFLLEHVDEWEEEMNNVVNNGLLVLKRRKPSLQFLEEAFKSDGTANNNKTNNNKSMISFSSSSTENVWNSSTHTFVLSFQDGKHFELEPPKTIRRALTEKRGGGSLLQFPGQGFCERAFHRMYQKLDIIREKISPPCNVATIFSRRTFAESTYLMFLRLDDDELPMRIATGLILSHVASALSTVSSKRQGDGIAFLWSCEFSALIASVHGVAQTHLLPNLKILPMSIVVPLLSHEQQQEQQRQESDIIINFEECKHMKHEINSYISTYDLVKKTKFPKRPNSIHIMIISGNNLRDLMVIKNKSLRIETVSGVIATVRHRVVVFGTWMVSPKRMAEFHEILVSKFDFELKVKFDTHTGFAMWEKRESYELSYIPEAKRKRNEMLRKKK